MKHLLFIFSVLLLLSSCSEQVETFKDDTSIETIPQIKCNECLKKLSSKPFFSKISLQQPTIITFFDLWKSLEKFGSNPISIDSLPKPLQNPNRGLIYQTTDQFGTYKTYFEPFIKKNNIKVIPNTSLINNSVLILNKDTIQIHPDFFKNMDGVVLFSPNKKPVVWRFSFSSICNSEDILKCYFN